MTTAIIIIVTIAIIVILFQNSTTQVKKEINRNGGLKHIFSNLGSALTRLGFDFLTDDDLRLEYKKQVDKNNFLKVVLQRCFNTKHSYDVKVFHFVNEVLTNKTEPEIMKPDTSVNDCEKQILRLLDKIPVKELRKVSNAENTATQKGKEDIMFKKVLVEEAPAMISLIKSQYSADDWEFANNHPNLIGEAARAMINNYIEDPKLVVNHRQQIESVIHYRRIAGGLCGYGGGDNTQYFDGETLRAFLNYVEYDLCATIYGLAFIESEVFRLGISQDENASVLFTDIILVNVVEKLKGKGMTLRRSELLSKNENFKNEWYDQYFLN